MMIRYNHGKKLHNLESPTLIVPEIFKLFKPKSVVDFGCGTGTFLSCFKKLGVKNLLGIDGAWVNRDLLYDNIDSSEFLERDLGKPLNLDRSFDLVVSLEVAEHLLEEQSDNFVKNLVNAGGLILFSAAIPFQGGQNHLNEQKLSYWVEKFEKHNYILHDIIRPIFWETKEVFWWYKQNMVVFAHDSIELNLSLSRVPIQNLVHFELYESKIKQISTKNKMIESISRGRQPFVFYAKCIIFAIFGFNNIMTIKNVFKR